MFAAFEHFFARKRLWKNDIARRAGRACAAPAANRKFERSSFVPRDRITQAEATAKRGLSFAELSHVEAGHLERLLAGEIQWAMQKMFRQYDTIADLLVPAEFVPKEKPTVKTEKAKIMPQPQLNYGE